MKATGVTAGLAESNGSLLPGLWRDSLHVTCGLTACTPGSAPGPTLGNEYGKTLPLLFVAAKCRRQMPCCQSLGAFSRAQSVTNAFGGRNRGRVLLLRGREMEEKGKNRKGREKGTAKG